MPVATGPIESKLDLFYLLFLFYFIRYQNRERRFSKVVRRDGTSCSNGDIQRSVKQTGSFAFATGGWRWQLGGCQQYDDLLIAGPLAGRTAQKSERRRRAHLQTGSSAFHQLEAGSDA